MIRTFIFVALAASVAAGPASAHEFLFYFAHGSSELRREDIHHAEAAARYARQDDVARVRVVAHADTSGPAAYNLALSKARAERIAAELVRFGVDRTQIDTVGMGEAEPAVLTPDGVREPLNRRGTIQHVMTPPPQP